MPLMQSIFSVPSAVRSVTIVSCQPHSRLAATFRLCHADFTEPTGVPLVLDMGLFILYNTQVATVHASSDPRSVPMASSRSVEGLFIRYLK